MDNKNQVVCQEGSQGNSLLSEKELKRSQYISIRINHIDMP